MSVTKSFKIREHFTAQFRVEIFNLLNRPELREPIGGRAAGRQHQSLHARNQMALVSNTPDQAGSNPVLGSGGARDLQLGLKLIF